MSEIRVKENESLESALKRFKRSCAKDGVIAQEERALCQPESQAEAEV